MLEVASLAKKVNKSSVARRMLMLSLARKHYIAYPISLRSDDHQVRLATSATGRP